MMKICDDEGEEEGGSEMLGRWLESFRDFEVQEKPLSNSRAQKIRRLNECWLSKEEREEKFKNFLLDRAQIAVKLYNKALDNKDKELELVDALACQTYLLRGIYYHLNFTAKPKDGPDEETKRYFAEFKRVHNDDGVLTKICPVEPKAATSNAEIHYGCAACYWAYEIYHPPDKEFNIACQKF